MEENKENDKQVPIKELSKSEKLEKAFAKERVEISEFIKVNITSKMNDIQNIANVQVHILSQRQRLVDKANELRSANRKQKQLIASARNQKYRFYKLEYDLKLNDYEIKNHIEADIESTSSMMKMIDNQILFYKETTETVDKCIWMVKYLIESEKYKSGGF
tara:strand:+ start:2194 stop:2676 length:483 start_codon:yes stop_codon:yes gene_type:complete